ncbi:hypothetical protein [Nitrobacter sp. JJSN]|jgi:hypothetical protein|uniref:hypothetical protein n=1 Tax=Nitrobacter sp. JJSN TaxID=3453033 RepID=UPI003F75C4EB
MSLKTKIAAVALVAITATGMVAGSTQHADARGLGLGLGIAAGVIGAAAVGSAIAADSYDYDGYRRCGWVRQYDTFGNYVGRVRVCD